MAVNMLLQVSVCTAVVCLQILCCTATTDTKLTRKLRTTTQCTNSSGDGATRLLYTRADGTADSLHYLFSTVGLPSVLVVRTGLNGALHVNCEHFFGNTTDMAHSVSYTDQHYAYSITFNRLLEYNDTDDKADLDQVKAGSWRVHDLNKLPWDDMLDSSDIATNKVAFSLQNRPGSNLKFHDNGSLAISMEVMGVYARESLLPHLEYNANMTRLRLTLDRVNTSDFTSARFALEMTLVSLDGVPNMMALNTQKYIDDEHSPGVFEMVDWTAKGSNQVWSGFLQYKPVCYTNPGRSLNDATKAFYYDLITPNATRLQPLPCLPYAYFGPGMYSGNFSMTMANISFGISKDKFYTKTNYMVWSASVGFGKPPSDQISLLIIIILSVGLGLPILLISFGSVGICIRNKMRSASPYQEITSSSPEIN